MSQSVSLYVYGGRWLSSNGVCVHMVTDLMYSALDCTLSCLTTGVRSRTKGDS